jgi:hypothetical protein
MAHLLNMGGMARLLVGDGTRTHKGMLEETDLRNPALAKCLSISLHSFLTSPREKGCKASSVPVFLA